MNGTLLPSLPDMGQVIRGRLAVLGRRVTLRISIPAWLGSRNIGGLDAHRHTWERLGARSAPNLAAPADATE